MAVEIERKFLLASEDWRGGEPGVAYRQGYLVSDAIKTVRVRVAGERAYLTIKGGRIGIARPEYEYRIPVPEAEAMLAFCEPNVIVKTRYRVPYADHVWEIDEFHGANEGLLVAEVELEDATETVELPPWVAEEVTVDIRYQNACLSRNPYSSW
jgi:adenylate cyclase